MKNTAAKTVHALRMREQAQAYAGLSAAEKAMRLGISGSMAFPSARVLPYGGTSSRQASPPLMLMPPRASPSPQAAPPPPQLLQSRLGPPGGRTLPPVQSKFDGTELAEATAATVSSTTSGDK